MIFASAPLDDILHLWQGLGYYRRARNLHHCIRAIVDQYNGIVPNAYEALMTLPGIGPYTAAAIASFAYHQPHAVLDGNVYRVLARLLHIDIPLGTSTAQRNFCRSCQRTIR